MSILIGEPDLHTRKLLTSIFLQLSSELVAVSTYANFKLFLKRQIPHEVIIIPYYIKSASNRLISEIRNLAGNPLLPVVLVIDVTKSSDASSFDWVERTDLIITPVENSNLIVERFRQLMRAPSFQPEVECAGINLLASGETLVDSQIVELTQLERNMLRVLISYPGSRFSKQVLADIVWSLEVVGNGTLLSQISRLRAKLGPKGKLIERAGTGGYRFAPNP